jgi:hypothetical protein
MIRQMRMDEFTDAHPGLLLDIDYTRGAKVNRPVSLMVELKGRKYRPELKRWDWYGEVVKCSRVLVGRHVGAKIWINPDDHIAVTE